ncbi:MAG: PhoH family protein [Candidatus Woesearchaeota archaeon]
MPKRQNKRKHSKKAVSKEKKALLKLIQEEIKYEKSSETPKHLIPPELIYNYSFEIFKHFLPKDGRKITEIYVDLDKLPIEKKRHPEILSFLHYVNKNGIWKESENCFLVDKQIKLFYHKPEDKKQVDAIATDPLMFNDLLRENFRKVEYPSFPKKNLELLVDGSITKINLPSYMEKEINDLTYSKKEFPLAEIKRMLPQNMILNNNKFFILNSTKYDKSHYLQLHRVGDNKHILENIFYRKSKEEINQEISKPILGFSPINLEQYLLTKVLRDPKISLVVVTGVAGSGKTLTSLACALRGLMVKNEDELPQYYSITMIRGKEEDSASLKAYQKLYTSLGITKPPFEDLSKYGESMEYPYDENLSSYHYTTFKRNGVYVGSRIPLFEYWDIDKIKGTTFQNTEMVVDESQNILQDEMEKIVDRQGKNSKLVIIGDPQQTKKEYLNKPSGISWLLRFIQQNLDLNTAVIYLNETQRSESAGRVYKN